MQCCRCPQAPRTTRAPSCPLFFSAEAHLFQHPLFVLVPTAQPCNRPTPLFSSMFRISVLGVRLRVLHTVHGRVYLRCTCRFAMTWLLGLCNCSRAIPRPPLCAAWPPGCSTCERGVHPGVPCKVASDACISIAWVRMRPCHCCFFAPHRRDQCTPRQAVPTAYPMSTSPVDGSATGYGAKRMGSSDASCSVN